MFCISLGNSAVRQMDFDSFLYGFGSGFASQKPWFSFGSPSQTLGGPQRKLSHRSQPLEPPWGAFPGERMSAKSQQLEHGKASDSRHGTPLVLTSNGCGPLGDPQNDVAPFWIPIEKGYHPKETHMYHLVFKPATLSSFISGWGHSEFSCASALTWHSVTSLINISATLDARRAERRRVEPAPKEGVRLQCTISLLSVVCFSPCSTLPVSSCLL